MSKTYIFIGEDRKKIHLYYHNKHNVTLVIDEPLLSKVSNIFKEKVFNLIIEGGRLSGKYTILSGCEVTGTDIDVRDPLTEETYSYISFDFSGVKNGITKSEFASELRRTKLERIGGIGNE